MAQWRKVVVSGSTAELNDISASGHIVPVTADGGALGSAIYEWSDLYLADSSVINFGADQDTTLTHTDGSGIALNSTNKIGFGGNFNAYIQHDGTDLKLSDDADINLVAGADILLDAATTVKIDSAAGDVSFEDAGTAQLAIDMDGTGGQIDVQLKVDSDDLVFKQFDGNEVIRIADDRRLYFYDQGGEHISSDGSILSIAAGAELHLSASMVDIGANTISGSHASTGSFGYLNIHGDAVIAGDLTFGDAATDLVSFGADIGSHLIPNTTATYDLGTTSQGWNDLHLGDLGVINFNNGDITLTHASNEIQVDGGDLVIESTNKIGFGGAPSTDYIQKDTDVKIVAAADITLDPAGGNVKPASNDDAALGVAGTGWSDLFLAEGAVINWDSGDFTVTQAGNLLTLTGGNTRVDRLEIDSANDYLDVDTDLKIVATADITLDPGGNNVKPGSDNADALGVSGTAWSDLFLGDGAVVNFNAGDVTLTHATGKLTWGGDGAVEIDFNNHEMTNVDIDSGAIDGTTIGASSHTTIKGTTVDATTDFTIDGLVITADNITNDAGLEIQTAAGDIVLDPAGNNVLPGSNNADALGASGTSWSDLFLGDGAVVNFNAGDVTLTHASGKLTWGGDGAVEIDFNNHEMTNIDVNSGAIDGTTIGGATPAAGTFTTLVANGNVDLGNATSDTITATAQFDSDLVPSTDSARDLGTTSLYWRNAYIDSITTTGDVTVNGSLDINGTLTTIDTTNLRVADRFIIVASGSTSGDGGIIANTGAAGIGSAFYYDDSASRWALTAADDTSGSATSASPRQYLVSVSQSALPPDDWEAGVWSDPSDFGTDNASRRGMIYVETQDHAASLTLAGDIWIWS